MGTRGERRSEDSGARSVRGRQPERMLRVIAEPTERIDVFRARRVRSCLSLSDNKYHPSLHKPTLSASFLPYELCYTKHIHTIEHNLFFSHTVITCSKKYLLKRVCDFSHIRSLQGCSHAPTKYIHNVWGKLYISIPILIAQGCPNLFLEG